jgi:hypothetical protein
MVSEIGSKDELDELIKYLQEAAEVEHGVLCQYFSESEVSFIQHLTVGWSRAWMGRQD